MALQIRVGDASTVHSGLPKVTGAARYASDIYPEGMLTGLVVRSPYPHCRIKQIDTRAAQAMSGVHAVLTAKDVPGLNVIGKTVLDQPILAHDKARTVLDALVLIAADSLRIARKAASALQLDLDPLPAVFSVEDALAPGAPQVHAGRSNLLREVHLGRGDVARGLAEADVIVEETYYTPAIEHAYLEPDAGVALPTPDGGVKIWVGCHSVYAERQIAAQVLDLPEDKVEVVQPYTGGSFGGKDDGLLTAYLALLAYHSGLPVRIAFSRRELFRSHTKRHPQKITVRTGATRTGQLTAATYRIVTDTGAYAHWAEGIFQFASIGTPGPYRIPNVRVNTAVVYTNNIPMGAMRAWGMPGVTFATESQLDQLAEKLDLHPLVLRWINAVEEGDEIITGQRLPAGVGLKATLATAAQDMGVTLPE